MPNKHIAEIIRFGISGVAGFIVDAGIVFLITRELRPGLIVAQMIAFTVAVTVTWTINRHWTIAEHASDKWLRELTRYITANSVGAVVNNGLYAILVLTLAVYAKIPVLAVGRIGGRYQF